MKKLRNKVAVVSGVASGIGKALAIRLAEQGVRLAVTDINQEGLEQTAAVVREQRVDVLPRVLDMTNREGVSAFAEEVVSEMGQVDIVINNAGAALGKISVKELAHEDFEWMMNVNLWSVIHGTKAFLPHLISRPEASLVNVSSIFGMIGVACLAAYCTSKFAVRGFSEALRMEMMAFHPHVTISSVHPGGIKTNLIHNSRWPAEYDPVHRQREIERFEKSFVTTPEQAAGAIVRGIQRKQSRILIGRDAWVLDKLVRLLPVRSARILGKKLFKQLGGLPSESATK